MSEASKFKVEFLAQAESIIIGQSDNLLLALICFLSKGHLLIEDLPGMGKTTMVKTIGTLLGLKTQRIQATSDLLPQDVLGNSIYRQTTESFELFKGPIFSELVFVDELNRASPKTQSAFLEGMEERSVTIDGTKLELPNPFFLVATQNPTSQVGTHFLPESQLDRFLFVLFLGLPDRETEMKMLLNQDPTKALGALKPICTVQELIKFQDDIDKIHASEETLNYLLDIIRVAREDEVPLSPRASKQLLRAARARAWLEGREFIIPEDINFVSPNLIAHRIQNFDKKNLKNVFERAKTYLDKVEVA